MRIINISLGLVAVAHGLPAAPQDAPPQLEERQFTLGDPSVTLCVGNCRPSHTWQVPKPTFIIGKRGDDDVDVVESSCGSLASRLKPQDATSATRLVMDQCLLLFRKHGYNVARLGAWTEALHAKRDEQIIISSCTEGDVAALTKAYKDLLAQYGRDNVPYDVAVLLESIKAALFYCALAAPITGPIIPDDVVIGDPVTPDPTIPGGPIVPDPSFPGGPIIPDEPIEGGPMEPDA
ncbi:hypothetical protein B0I35DRAFT_75090 [Stachybotrys elegans]|uniref:Ecp2 effector protein domain-containing protein n=1 Tax=Stachybotrys elegans TaxID=80388 RepID=A0A8K0WMF7_9HYPO|nr:hypothetical protein B0I35DRAFT_75090 [Stachybotrys elegans]